MELLDLTRQIARSSVRSEWAGAGLYVMDVQLEVLIKDKKLQYAHCKITLEDSSGKVIDSIRAVWELGESVAFYSEGSSEGYSSKRQIRGGGRVGYWGEGIGAKTKHFSC